MTAPLTPATIAPHLQPRWLAAAAAADGTVVIAEAQRAGRGRLGRSWASPAGKNLYLSAVLRCEMPAERLAQISPLAGVAVCETVREWCAAEIKWPNDVLSDGRKVAGILAEMDSAETGHVIILGIGVNLNADLDDFREAVRDKAGSVGRARGRPARPAAFTAGVLDKVEV